MINVTFAATVYRSSSFAFHRLSLS